MTGIGQTNFLQSLGWAVLNSLWQMALLWVIYQLIISVFFKSTRQTAKSSAAKSSLASIMLIAGFGWFIYTFVSIYYTHTSVDAVISSAIVNADGNQQLNNWLHKTLPIASILYLALLLFPILHFLRNYRYVQVIRQYGLAKADVQWRVFVKKVAAQMGIVRPVYIWVSELVSSPVTIGYLKPVILLPVAAINHLTTQQLEAVLLHELSHIKRYDYLVNLVINFIQTLLYYNPFVKSFVKTIEREREKSCDEMVMQFQYDPHGYAEALLILEKTNYVSRPLAVAVSGKKNDLLHRVELILGVQRKPVISFNKLAGLFAGLLCIIALNALLIMSKPVNTDHGFAFVRVPSPFYFFSVDNNSAAKEPATNEKKTVPIINHAEPVIAKTKNNIQEPAPPPGYHLPHSPEANPGFVNANFEITPDAPKLKHYQEREVKEVLDASKKVLEEVQWKAVENSIADAFTQKEKEQLKTTYRRQLERLDWKKWEGKLRLAYNDVDWERVNEQLGKEINQIRLDSLQHVYSEASLKLDRIQQTLSENDLKGIPDSDVTLEEVQQKKQLVQKALANLKAIRTKKIVHL